jgi:hypothetical protein
MNWCQSGTVNSSAVRRTAHLGGLEQTPFRLCQRSGFRGGHNASVRWNKANGSSMPRRHLVDPPVCWFISPCDRQFRARFSLQLRSPSVTRITIEARGAGSRVLTGTISSGAFSSPCCPTAFIASAATAFLPGATEAKTRSRSRASSRPVHRRSGQRPEPPRFGRPGRRRPRRRSRRPPGLRRPHASLRPIRVLRGEPLLLRHIVTKSNPAAQFRHYGATS